MPVEGNETAANVKSGVMPAAPAKLDVAMIHRTSLPEALTFPGTRRRTPKKLPSAFQALRREFATMFWPPASIFISTYSTVVSPVIPNITSSMTAK
jgi:hypothetical protein